MAVRPCWSGGTVHAVAAPGGTLIAETLGTGPALLLLHGWTLDRRLWSLQAPLAARHTLIAIDRRGFGQSTAPPDLAAEPDDVLRVAATFGLDRFHLLGMSQGGRVALALAARAPDRLLSLMLQGSALDDVTGPDEGVPIAAMASAAERADFAALRALWAGHPLMACTTPRARRIAAAMLGDYAGRDLVILASALPASTTMLAGKGVAITTLTGADDTLQRQANAAALASAGAVSVTLPGGHLCNLDAPAAFNAAVATAIITRLRHS
jgi:pimeloyl-ACP methyl ester carboxylesterase